MSGPRDKHEAIQAGRVEWKGQTIWQAMNVKDLADGLDLHPCIVGLIFELPFTAVNGKPQWTRQRRYQWEQTLKASLDLIYEMDPVVAEAAARQIEEAAQKMIAPLREKIEAEHEQQVAALKATIASERDNLTAKAKERDELQRRLDRALGDLAARTTRRLPDADPAILPSGRPDPPVAPLKGGSVNQVAKRIVDEATRERTAVDKASEALMRTAAEVAGEPEAANEAIRRRNGSVEMRVAHGELPDSDQPGRCRVDGCSNSAGTIGRWGGICETHRTILLREGSTVIIGGVEHVLVRGQGGGKIRPQAEAHAAR